MRRMYDENEIKSIASESGGGKLYKHIIKIDDTNDKTRDGNMLNAIFISSIATKIEFDYLFTFDAVNFYSNLINGYTTEYKGGGQKTYAVITVGSNPANITIETTEGMKLISKTNITNYSDNVTEL